ncbi:GLPGLI family protein [Namhaeicola litoreus]|uniref:GLPGLI family protein n=1 Tax=Namhaeicola litoreus TaxID=1052145 RepID=A0ABW3XZC4_9FLAO
MKTSFLSQKPLLFFTMLMPLFLFAQDFQGKAYYFSKSTMELGSFGATMSEAQKKQIQERLKNRLEKTYILTFNKEESTFKEDEKIDAISGATDSWGKNFSPGEQYKNIKTKTLLQRQEFYGKQFLIKDDLLSVNWKIGTETKKIGQYTCFRATASIPSSDLAWYDFSWDSLRNREQKKDSVGDAIIKDIKMTDVVAWYTPQVPLSQGPLEYWGLPGLILEINVGGTTILCSKIVMNPEEKSKIEAPDKGKIVSKQEYQEIISSKMQEMRDNRGRQSSRR